MNNNYINVMFKTKQKAFLSFETAKIRFIFVCFE